jgi:hypothetical protein
VAGLDDISDDDLRRELSRRRPKRIRVREYEIDEDQYRRLHGPDNANDNDDEDDDEDEDGDGDGAGAKKSGGTAKRSPSSSGGKKPSNRYFG